jgi:excisionase family DNA binding protein
LEESKREAMALGEPQPLRDVLAADPLLLTPEEAAQVLRVGRTTIYALMKAGELRPVHIGRSCRLSRTELERYVDRLQAPPPQPPKRAHRRQGRAPTDQGELFDLVHNPLDAP